MERFRWGGGSGESRFGLDLAEHLQAISTPPPLPDGWLCEVAVALADDAAIGGDFTVFSRDGLPYDQRLPEVSSVADDATFDVPGRIMTSDAMGDLSGRDRLRVMLVDASGKGAEAATRCVMLAGAINGLLAELPLDAVLPAVNRHVTRLGSEENFATAALVELELGSGAFQLGVAGHPSPARFEASTGRWSTYDATGPALGFLPDASWTFHTGVLAAADALIIVTDGVVEVPGADVDWGIDRLMGHAERLVLNGWTGGAQQLLNQRKGAGNDDAQVLLLARRPSRTSPTPIVS